MVITFELFWWMIVIILCDSYSFRRFKDHPYRMLCLSRTQASFRNVDQSFHYIPNVPPDSRIPALVTKYCHNFDRYCSTLPHGKISVISFQYCRDFVQSFYKNRDVEGNSPKVILDSGCGKGSSTIEIAKRNPEYPVIGIERSHARLSFNKQYVALDPGQLETNDNDPLLDDEHNDEEHKILQISEKIPNLLLVRAELSSFWNLLVRNTDWTVVKHYLLHPNPCPKPGLIKFRFPSSPSFPFFPLLGGSLTVRSNWRTYCEEMELAVQTLQDTYPPLISNTQIKRTYLLKQPKLFSHFDRKYAQLHVPMYELKVHFPQRSKFERQSYIESISLLHKKEYS